MKVILAAYLIVLLIKGMAGGSEPAYRDPDRPIEERVEDLLQRMTLAEKIGQMTQIEVTRLMGSGQWDRGPLNEDWLQTVLVDHHVGSILSGGGSAPIPNTPQAWTAMTNTIQRHAMENSRLGIPIIYGVDAVHGHNTVLGATIFPHNIGLAAAANVDLVEKLAHATAGDVRATGIHWNFGPVADLGLDLRWGRFYETFGEDPYLASSLAAASVRGQQGADLKQGIAATGKHFLGYGVALQGQDRGDASLSLRELRTIHYPPFEAVIDQGVSVIMPNSGTINGIPVHASRQLLTDVLRDDMGFTGVVVSDWEDIHKLYQTYKITDSFADAVGIAINAGVDMYMVPHDAAQFTGALHRQVEAGVVSMERVDEAVRRILTLKFELGLFEDPYAETEAADERIFDAHRPLALRAALESMTLLQNNGVLPLGVEPQRVLVIGPAAHNVRVQMGGWTIDWQGIPENHPHPPAVTILEGIENWLGTGAVVDHLRGIPEQGGHNAVEAAGEAVLTAADGADAVIVVLGEEPYAEGEGDRLEPRLAREEEQLIKSLAAAGHDVVLVLLSGRPLLIAELVDHTAAILMAYLPGTAAGDAVAQVLFGEYNPAGRLPFSWPFHTGQLPMHHNGPHTIQYDPLFAFGHGLSYSPFRYSGLVVEGLSSERAVVQVTVDVTNEGDRDGDHIVQVFARQPSVRSTAGPAVLLEPMPQRQRLVGFQRIHLNAGETVTVDIPVAAEQLMVVTGDVFGDGPKRMASGRWEFSVGSLRRTADLDFQ